MFNKRKNKSIINNKLSIASLTKEIDKYEKMKVKENKYYLMCGDYAKKILLDKNINLEDEELLYDLFKEWDNYGSIPLELGKKIEILLNDQSICLGIHHISGMVNIDNSNPVQDKVLNSIFSKGLINNGGDVSLGVVEKNNIDPCKTISPITNILNAIILIKSTYKGSNGGVLVALPSNLVDKNLYLKENSNNKIYDNYDDINYIKPNFLIGYISQINGNCTFYSKNEFDNLSKKSDKTI